MLEKGRIIVRFHKKNIFELLTLVLVVALAVVAVLPASVMATSAPAEYTITIRNAEGLPAMVDEQFNAFQLFKGTPNREDEPEVKPGEIDWNASEWNNWTLADIQWGDNIGESNGALLLNALKDIKNVDAGSTKQKDDWPGFFNGNTSIIADHLSKDGKKLDTAADLAEFLVGKSNAFLQTFCKFVLEGNVGKGTLKGYTNSFLTGDIASSKAEQDKTVPPDHQKDISKITVTSPGYYLIVETDNDHSGVNDAVSEYILAVLGNQEINLKASIPTVDKDIVVGSALNKGDVDGVGDFVQFRLVGTLPKNFADYDTYAYSFHDTLSGGLEYVESDAAHPLEVYVYSKYASTDGKITVNEADGTKVATGYTTAHPGKEEAADSKCSLEISFADLKTLENAESAPISVEYGYAVVVTYYAKVTEDAVIGDAGNPNDVHLTYSNNPNGDGEGRTNEKRVYVYSFGLDLTKVGSDDDHSAGLAGAGFVLKTKDGSKYATFKDQWVVKGKDDNSQTFFDSEKEANDAFAKMGETKFEQPKQIHRLTGWDSNVNFATALAEYKKDPATKKNEIEKYLLESIGLNGKIYDIYGLDAGDYALEEVIVPQGYNSMADFDISITAEIDKTTGVLNSVTYTHGGKSTTYDLGDGHTDITAVFHSGLLPDKIENQKAPFLPFTGGVGVGIFYTVGALVVIGAAAYIIYAVTKRGKRTSSDVAVK